MYIFTHRRVVAHSKAIGRKNRLSPLHGPCIGLEMHRTKKATAHSLTPEHVEDIRRVRAPVLPLSFGQCYPALSGRSNRCLSI